MTSALWSNGPALPATFTVQIRGDVVQFGTLPELPVLARTPTAFAAGRPGTILEAHIEGGGWLWSYIGIEGRANGTMREVPDE